MNKQDLAEAMALGADISKAAATRALDAAIRTITAAVAGGDQVTISGFGSFKVTQRQARKGKNPKTGESIDIAAAKHPRFSPGATFKAVVAGKK